MTNPDTAPLTWGYFFGAFGLAAAFVGLGVVVTFLDRMRGEWRRFREWRDFDEWEREWRAVERDEAR